MPALKIHIRNPHLPPEYGFESVAIYKALAKATRSLAELKGLATSIPNQGILIDSLTLQEAKASSEIENIVTTQDDLFRIDITMERKASGPAKEVALYRDARRLGWRNLKENQDIISNRSLIEQFQLLKGVCPFPGIVVHDIQDTKTTAIAQLVGHKVHGPTDIDGHG